MMRKGKVFIKDTEAGVVWENDEGYGFQYNGNYIEEPSEGPVSKTLPVRKEPYFDKSMIPFFDGLIPEGWFLNIAAKNWKLDVRDRMGLLLTLCRDCIGAVSIQKINE